MQSGSDAHLKQLTEQLAKLMIENKQQLVSAESCTGGWLAKCCTDLVGSSSWFELGFVTYCNAAKQSDLNVSPTTLMQFGAVSEETAIEMAEGAIENSRANLGIAITGIAGPTGDTATKPVGTVCFALSIKNQSTISQTKHFKGNRDAVRRQALVTAFEGIIKNARDVANSVG